MNTLKTSVRFTVVTMVLLGVLYPLAVTLIAQLTMRDNANGQMVSQNGAVVGSKLIGQGFQGTRYFHGRPSAAGSGYDASSSGGTNLAASSQKLVDRIHADVSALQSQKPGTPVPIDLVTTSGSGLDPDITPAAAFYQVDRVAAARHLPENEVRSLVAAHVQNRQFGVLGEPRVNVLALNLALDAISR